MYAATADLECDIAYGKKSREFLGQSVGFENELISQTNFPPPRTQRTWLFFLLDRFLRERLENRPETAASGPEYAVKRLRYARRKAVRRTVHAYCEMSLWSNRSHGCFLAWPLLPLAFR
jgi:hypothetical protein